LGRRIAGTPGARCWPSAPFLATSAILFADSSRQLRAPGFRRRLLLNGVLNAASILACALLLPTTPMPFIATGLFVGALARSIQFSA
jgi:hypothetical protein